LDDASAAGLVTNAIDILNDNAGGVLPVAYRDTAKKLSESAEGLKKEAKRFKGARE
jgi:hypothetical protein